MTRVALLHRPIDTSAILAEVQRARNGATVLFLGTVREINEGRSVTGIEYSAYESMAARELATIVDEAARRYEIKELVVEHRLGRLDIGESSVAIAAAHPHRAQAFEAARYIIEQLKRRVPIWKLEHYVDGTREWIDPTGRAAPLVAENVGP
jgi:molybdopterin synthase catalytic subunit